MAGPEANLWKSMRQALKGGSFNPTRLENRHGGGVPDLELQWPTGSAFVELKAPRSTPRSTLQSLQIRPYLFANSAKSWEDAESEQLTCMKLMKSAPEHEYTSCVQSASLASNDQKAWHARRFANGGVSFFLQSTALQRSKSLFSPIIHPDTRELVLVEVVSHDSWSVVLYALRLCAEMHAVHVQEIET